MSGEVIYGLFDKAGALRYIGKAKCECARLKGHMREAGRRNTPLYAWIRKHGEPEVRVLERVEGDWREAERRLIAEGRARGDKLLNLADGGEQPFCSKEQRSKNAASLNAKLAADPQMRRVREMKRSIGSALKAGLVSNAARAKLRMAAEINPSLFGAWKHIPDRIEA